MPFNFYIEGTISKTDLAEKDSEYHAKLETLDAEEQRQLRDSELDQIVLEGLMQLDQPKQQLADPPQGQHIQLT